MAKNVYQWLHFSFWERWAIVFLALLALGLFFIHQWKRPSSTPMVDIQLQTDSPIAQNLDSHIIIPTTTELNLHNNHVVLHHLNYFDPNAIAVDSLIAMGWPLKLATTLDHFRQKGGRFRVPTDLEKVYGMTNVFFEQIAPYIKIARMPSKTVEYLPKVEAFKKERRFFQIDINEADSAAWESLPGIGPFLAARIIRFRDRLGGFYNIDQVAETFGMADSVFQRIATFLVMKKTALEFISLNKATWEQLRWHPYIGGKMAAAIIGYRKQHGSFQQADDLLAIMSITQEQVEKLKPYLVFE